MTKSMIPLLHDESRNDERNTDIGYPVAREEVIRSISRINGLRRRGGG